MILLDSPASIAVYGVRRYGLIDSSRYAAIRNSSLAAANVDIGAFKLGGAILRNRSTASAILAAIIFGATACAYSPPATSIAEGSEVGGTGGMSYSHEPLGGNMHFLTVDASPGLMETEGSIDQRIYQFAVRFAGSTCESGFDFVDDQNMQQSRGSGFMRRTRTYRFECREQS